MIEQITSGQSIGLAWSSSRSTLDRSIPGRGAGGAGGSAVVPGLMEGPAGLPSSWAPDDRGESSKAPAINTAEIGTHRRGLAAIVVARSGVGVEGAS
jgi:hypothetical protein